MDEDLEDDERRGCLGRVAPLLLCRVAGPVRVHCSGTTCNGRVNLTVSKSVTDARTWEPQTLLIHGPNPPNSSGGSGYSCLSDIPSRPQEMGLLFERDGPECW